MVEVVIYTLAARGDVRESHQWYEERETGLGEEFLRAVEACVEQVRRHPEMYPIAVDEFRRALVRRFPFEVIYRVSAGTLIIIAVFHCAQDPARWRLRVGEPPAHPDFPTDH